MTPVQGRNLHLCRAGTHPQTIDKDLYIWYNRPIDSDIALSYG